MKKTKRRKSPQNSRKLHAGIVLVLAGILALIFVINLYPAPLFGDRLAREKANREETAKITTEIKKYEEIIGKYPGYRDAYIKLAILNWKIYRDSEAKQYLKTALGIDPNNETANKLNLIMFP